MPNPNPYKARQGRKRRKKAGTVKQLTSVLWNAIDKLEDCVTAVTDMEASEVDTAELCKLTHALSQSASTYLKAIEVGELEARVEQLEAAQQATDYRRAA